MKEQDDKGDEVIGLRIRLLDKSNEIERLKAKIEFLQKHIKDLREEKCADCCYLESHPLHQEHLDEIEKLNAEVARYREALERISRFDSYHQEWPNDIYINAPPEELASFTLDGIEYKPEALMG